MLGIAGLIAALTPIWIADHLVSALRTRARRGHPTTIPRVALADGNTLAELMEADRPVIITDLYERLELTTRPDVAGLRSIAPGSSFPVHRHHAGAPYFLYVGDYGAVKMRTDQMTIGPFLEQMFSDHGTAHHGTAHDDTAHDDTAHDDTCTYKLFAIDALDGGVGEIIGEMAAQLETMSKRRADPSASGIWIGSEGVTTPLHHDAWTGLLFQPVGSKQVTMYAPHDRRNIYFSSPFRPTSRWTGLPARSSEADPREFPRLARATRHEGLLEAGDTLFIPPYWSHEVQALEPNISIPFRFATRRIDHLNPGFLRPAVEIFHKKYLAVRQSAS
jgi:hypothetical protein